MDFLFKKPSTETNSPSEPPQGDNSFTFKFSSGASSETGNVFSFLDRGSSSPPSQVGSSNNGNFSFLFKDSVQSSAFTPSQPESSSLNTSSGHFPFNSDATANKNTRISQSSLGGMPSSLFGSVSPLTPSKRLSNEMEATISDQEQPGTEKESLNNSLLKSPPSLQPPTKKVKQISLHESISNKENIKPAEDNPPTISNTLPFSPKKFSLSAASPIKASPQQSNNTEFSTPKKPLQPTNSSMKMTPLPAFHMKSPGTPLLQQTPTKPSPMCPTHVNTPRPPITHSSSVLTQKGEEEHIQQSIERTEKFVSKHRSDLDEMKDVEQQLEGVKRKDTELSKTMEEINNKMTEYSDSLKTLTLKVTLLTNKMLMSQCPIINEKVEQIHSKYAHLIN